MSVRRAAAGVEKTSHETANNTRSNPPGKAGGPGYNRMPNSPSKRPTGYNGVPNVPGPARRGNDDNERSVAKPGPAAPNDRSSTAPVPGFKPNPMPQRGVDGMMDSAGQLMEPKPPYAGQAILSGDRWARAKQSAKARWKK